MSSSAESAGRWTPEELDGSPAAAPATTAREAASPWAPPEIEDASSRNPAEGARSTARAAAKTGRPAASERPAPEAWTAPPLDMPQGHGGDKEPGGEPEPSGTYEEGYEAGLQEGEARAWARIEPATDALREIAAALAASQGDILRNLEANVAALAVGVARKIVQREISTAPEILQDLVGKALDLVKPGSPIEIRLNPEDLDVIRDELSRIPVDDRVELRWTADPGIDRGGFFVEGPERIIDGRLEESLRNLYERLIYE